MPDNIFLLAYLDGQPVGYARLLEHEAPAGMGEGPAVEIVRIYAEQSAIGKGVGKSLMQYALDLAREKGKQAKIAKFHLTVTMFQRMMVLVPRDSWKQRISQDVANLEH